MNFFSSADCLENENLLLPEVNPLIGCLMQRGHPKICIHTAKMDTVGSIYMFVHTCTHTYIDVCIKMIKDKMDINLKGLRKSPK